MKPHRLDLQMTEFTSREITFGQHVIIIVPAPIYWGQYFIMLVDDYSQYPLLYLL